MKYVCSSFIQGKCREREEPCHVISNREESIYFYKLFWCDRLGEEIMFEKVQEFNFQIPEEEFQI